MRIHLIAMGGSVMHNLALALHHNGHTVTGSDDEIYNPAKDRLLNNGLLPPEFGWFPEKISTDLDFVILGMHARADNPELARAVELGIKVFSFPEFIFQHAKNKTRIVVAGSHGKTTTTAIILHVLKKKNLQFDYLVGAQLEGFDTMVQLSEAPVMVIEGDEYLSSPVDRQAKFLHYHPHITIVTGIAWDHINVFPTFEEYKRQFELLAKHLEPGGKFIFYQKDPHLREVVENNLTENYAIPYVELPHEVKNGKVWVKTSAGKSLPFEVFGDHNMANMKAAQLACLQLGIAEDDFLAAAASFPGAAKRLQVLAGREGFSAWLDFAHAPSKAQATVRAVKKLYPERKLVAVLELHTFSSLNKNFLPQYKDTLEAADTACVFYSPHTLEMKKMEAIEPGEIQRAFGHENLRVFTEKNELESFLKNHTWQNASLLLMTSGNFGGMNFTKVVEEFVQS